MTESTRDTWLWGALAIVLAVVGAYGAWTALRESDPPAQPLEVSPFYLQSFQLTNQAGQSVTQNTLHGQVYIACFFFTHCSESCPKQIEAMQRLQERFRRTNIRLLAFTVQPEKDDPARLKTYAEAQQADPDRWWFLTGDKATIRGLAARFRVAVQDNPDPNAPPGQAVAHSSRLYLIDRQGRIHRHWPHRPPGWNPVHLEHEAQEGWEAVTTPDPLAPVRQFEVNEKELRRLELQAIELDQDGIPFKQLPLANAILNSTCTFLLLVGWIFIRRGLVRSHAVCMVSAFLVSAMFLASYLHYHYYAGDTRFSGEGAVRYGYLALLASHVILAVVTVPLVLLTFYRALRRQWTKHKALARWTLPIWLYVSVTGILVYLFLYRFFSA